MNRHVIFTLTILQVTRRCDEIINITKLNNCSMWWAFFTILQHIFLYTKYIHQPILKKIITRVIKLELSSLFYPCTENTSAPVLRVQSLQKMN